MKCIQGSIPRQKKGSWDHGDVIISQEALCVYLWGTREQFAAHLNSEASAGEVRGNYLCFTFKNSDFFKLASCSERNSGWREVILFWSVKTTHSLILFVAVVVFIFLVWITCTQALILASAVGHTLKACLKMPLKGICHPKGWQDKCTRSERDTANNRQSTRKKHGSYE